MEGEVERETERKSQKDRGEKRLSEKQSPRSEVVVVVIMIIIIIITTYWTFYIYFT